MRKTVKMNDHLQPLDYEKMNAAELIKVFFRDNPDAEIETQEEMANRLADMTNMKKMSQSAISKGFEALANVDIAWKDSIYRITRDIDHKYRMITLDKENNSRIYKMLQSGAFEIKHTVHLQPSAFIFRVKSENLDDIRMAFEELLTNDNIFSIFTNTNSIMVVLDPAAPGYNDRMWWLSNFFDEDRLMKSNSRKK